MTNRIMPGIRRGAVVAFAVAALTLIPIVPANANAVLVSNCSSSKFAHQTISMASAGAVHKQVKDIYWSSKTVPSAGTSWFQPTYAPLKGYGTDLQLVAASHGGFWFNCQS